MASLPVVLVTCATGSTSSELVKLLSKSGKFIARAGVRDVEKGKKHFQGLPNVELVDINNEETFKGLHGIYLLIASPVPGDNTFNKWFNNAKDNNVNHLVFHSTHTSYPTNCVITNRITYDQEQEVRKSGLNFTVLRPSFFFQNTEKFYKDQILNDGKVYGSSHGGRYTALDVRDIAAAALEVFTEGAIHYSKSYPLTTEITSDPEWIKLVSESIGKKVEFIDIPSDQLKAGLAKTNLPPIIQQILLEVEQEKAEELAFPLTDDLSKLLKRTPISFKQYCDDFAQSLKN